MLNESKVLREADFVDRMEVFEKHLLNVLRREAIERRSGRANGGSCLLQ
jgi:hypothetical protein